MKNPKLSMQQLGRKSVADYKMAEKTPIIVVLDNVRSQNNIGSVFRTCDAFLIEAIYLCGISSTPPHREIHKTALGAEESVPWQYFENTSDAIEHLRKNGYHIFSVEQVANSIYLNRFQIEANKKYALVFGNEIKGVDQTIINMCDGCIEIPQFGTKHSFNIAVSAGIIIWEIFSQLNKEK